MLNKNCVILLCGGTGKRFDKKNPKQFYKIFGETILEINVRKFLSYNLIEKIIIVTSERFFNQTEKVCKKFSNITIIIDNHITNMINNSFRIEIKSKTSTSNNCT